jgi:hypothetical protein
MGVSLDLVHHGSSPGGVSFNLAQRVFFLGAFGRVPVDPTRKRVHGRRQRPVEVHRVSRSRRFRLIQVGVPSAGLLVR